MEEPNHSSESRLLSLPAEIRNMIYRHSLVETVIKIPRDTSPPNEPGLLQVNRQIRQETCRLYYTQNKFLWSIWAYNADIHIKWCRSSPFRLRSSTAYIFIGPRNWENIVRWLEAVYNKRGCPRLPGPLPRREGRPASSPMGGVAVQLFQIMWEMKKEQRSREQIRGSLEHVHEVLRIEDTRWCERAA
jgi:hypothetical protein